MKSEELALKIRIDSINMVHNAHASHIGGVLSMADIIAVLYSEIAKYDTFNPNWEDRDRIVLSKGHNGVGLYAALAEVGYFDKSLLETYGENGSIFSGHVSHKVPGVELSTGSLGHGLGVACGFALNAKFQNKSYHTYVIIGDGECDEGSIWEAAMFASQYQLDNLTVIIDSNSIQAMGFCKDIIDLEPLINKWQSFGWNAIEINGNNHKEIKKAFKVESNKPKVIVARTIKGKGVSFMENNLLWHYRDPQGEDYINAILELETKS